MGICKWGHSPFNMGKVIVTLFTDPLIETLSFISKPLKEPLKDPL